VRASVDVATAPTLVLVLWFGVSASERCDAIIVIVNFECSKV
jgi:hypothetical protein